MKALVERIREADALLGDGTKRIMPSEAATAAAARRSIVAARDLPAGHAIAAADLTWLRPSGGLPPGQEAVLIGRKLRRAVGAGQRNSSLTCSTELMCGIAGYVGRTRDPGRAHRRHARRSCATAGPTHEGHRSHAAPAGATSHLLHARLAIIDLDERSNQPFAVDGGMAVLQRRALQLLEVRAATGARGHELRTTSDTEVLAQVLGAVTGREALDRCEGMWAFAGYDQDRPADAGARPVRREAALCLPRRRRALLRLRGQVHRRPAGPAAAGRTTTISSAISSTATRRSTRRRATFFDGLEELRPGCWLERRTRPDASDERPLLAADRSRPASADMSYEEAVAGTRERLIRSVELRLRADVPLAFCMSGGVDSTSLISIAKRKSSTTTCTASRSSTTTSATRSRTWSSTRCATLGVRHTAIPVDTGGLPAEAARAGAPPRRAGLHDHLLRALAADGVDRRQHGYRISVSGTGRRRAVLRLLRPPPRLPARRPMPTGAAVSSARSRTGASTSRRSCATRSSRIPTTSSSDRRGATTSTSTPRSSRRT